MFVYVKFVMHCLHAVFVKLMQCFAGFGRHRRCDREAAEGQSQIFSPPGLREFHILNLVRFVASATVTSFQVKRAQQRIENLSGKQKPAKAANKIISLAQHEAKRDSFVTDYLLQKVLPSIFVILDTA